jgi:4-diphosphocytidyl-2-C-methyl-D-erythritol kinase
MLHEAAPAKVNLFLRVVGRRDDGYHLLDSLVVFAGIGDEVVAAPRADLRLTLDGPEAGALRAEPDNLVLRAARALAAAAARTADADLRLVKRLPVASGIGGGSTDAAATLRALLRLWGIAPEAVDLPGLALTLGADVPVCLAARAARMGGIGESITPPPRLPAFGLLLANPRIAVPTQAVFRARAGAFSAPARLPAVWPDASRMAADLAGLGNDLQDAALSLCPAIGAVLAAIAAQAGCLLARMSGSGATCFGIFATPAHAAAAAAALPESWWRWGGAPTHDAHETGRR